MPQVVLTRVDKLEDNINAQIKKGQIPFSEKEKYLRELQDIKIEQVVSKLSIPRNSVHFIENYHEGRMLSAYQILRAMS